jgi:hypothetical protein
MKIPDFSKFIRSMVKDILLQLPGLQILTLEIPTLRAYTFHTLYLDWFIGFYGKTTAGLTRPTENKCHTWDAGPGKILTWTGDNYWRSIRLTNLSLMYTVLTLYHSSTMWMPLRAHYLGLNPKSLVRRCADPECAIGCTRFIPERTRKR